MKNAINGEAARREAKPLPPDDLWQQMDSLRVEIQPIIPSNAFTYRDYAERYHTGLSTAKVHIEKLLEQGKIACVQKGSGIRKSYFVIARKK
jgi:hypothetical protein